METINGYEKALKEGANPRDIKIKLASEIVRMYHSEKDAASAMEYFIKTVSNKEMPDEVEEFKPSKYDIVSILVETKLASSNSDAKRTIDQGGVKVNGETIKDLSFSVPAGSVLQKGKLKFIKVI